MPPSRAHKSSTYTPSRGQFAGHTFRSVWEYRKTLAASKRRRGGVPVAIRSKKDINALTVLQREQRDDALEVLNMMRRKGLSLTRAVRQLRSEVADSKVTVRSVHKYVGAALYKPEGSRRWAPRKSDKILRIMRFPTEKGEEKLEVKDSRIASQISAYLNAVKRYLYTGDKSGLRKFRGKTIKVGDATYRFITAPKALEQLAEFGALEIDSIYEKSGRRPS